MIRLVFINFFRSKSVKIGMIFIVLAGFISLFVGKQFSSKTQKHIAETAHFQKENLLRNAAYFKAEIGYVLYYAKFALVNHAPTISGLAIGQRDVNSSIKSLTIRNLEAQKYDAELNNPYNLLIGNIDFSFVLIYLFPLLIIAFTYNIISEEKESGTWKIVSVQSNNTFYFILQLFAVRLVTILFVLFVLLSFAIPFLKIPLDKSLFLFTSVAIFYILFWFGLCFWIASLHRNSNFNAVISLSLWIALIIILPAAINNYLVNKYPVPEALDTTLKQRKGYHEKWDMDKNITMNAFYAHYPQYKKYTLPQTDFSWQAYYPMQQMGDDASAKQAKELREKLQQREKASKAIAQFIPTLHTQIQLNDIVQTGMANQLRFLDKTSQFHEKLRLYFYPKIFEESPVANEKWENFKIETFTDNTTVSLARLLMPVLFFVLVFMGLGWWNFRRKVY